METEHTSPPSSPGGSSVISEVEAWECKINELIEKFSSENPIVIIDQNNLFFILYNLGKYEEALVLQTHISKSIGGISEPNHAHALSPGSHLASILERQELDKAELLTRELIRVQSATLGPDHVDTYGSKNQLLALLKRRNKLDELIDLEKDMLGTLRRVCPGDEETLSKSLNLAYWMNLRGKSEEALELCSSVHRRRLEVLGPKNRDTLKVQCHVGVALVKQKRFSEGVRMLEMAVDGYSGLLGDEDQTTLEAKFLQAGALEKQFKWMEAATMYRHMLQTLTATTTLPPNPALGAYYSFAEKIQNKMDECEMALRIRDSTISKR